MEEEAHADHHMGHASGTHAVSSAADNGNDGEMAHSTDHDMDAGHHAEIHAGAHEGDRIHTEFTGGAHAGHGSIAAYETMAPDWLVSGLSDRLDADGNMTPALIGSGHQDHSMGEFINVHEVVEAAEAMGIDAEQFIRDFVADNSNFNSALHHDSAKLTGAVTVLNDMVAAVSMGGLRGDPETLELIMGSATNAALAGDGAALRQILVDAGGDVSMMTDQMLVNVWSGNAHFYNHSVLMGSEGLGGELTHLRSLNDNAMDGTVAGTRGGYNDKGEYRQRSGSEFEFFDNSNAFLDKFSYVMP